MSPDLAYERLTSGTLSKPLIDAQSMLAKWSGVYAKRKNVSRWAGQRDRTGWDRVARHGRKEPRWAAATDKMATAASADEVAAAATGGEVQLTEEQVVDGVGDFVTGRQRLLPTDSSPTARASKDDGIDQLVVIWKPVNAAIGEPKAVEDQFVADAIAYFETNDIPDVDFYHDDRIVPSMYGKGDRHNSKGRALKRDPHQRIRSDRRAAI